METKKRFKYFTISQWQEEEEYLREMHKKGWKFEKVTGLGMYHFVKCEPEDVVYRLDYNEDSESKEYQKLFEDCGWEYLQNFVGYSYFRKKANQENTEDDEIFSDVQSKLDMCKNVIKRRTIPLLVIFICIIIPQLVHLFALITGKNGGDSFDTVLFYIFCVLFVVYLWIFGTMTYQYLKVKRKV